MKYQFLISIIVLSGVYSYVFSQQKTKLSTNGQGSFFGQLGYNRSLYNSPTIYFNEGSFDFSLSDVRLRDEENTTDFGSFFRSSTPQINIKIGYFVKNKWAVIAGFNRYNIFIENNQNVQLQGYFPTNSHSSYTGNVEETIQLTHEKFNLRQRYGINYFSLGLQRNDMLGRTRKATFGIQLLYGIKAGGLFTVIDYTFDNNTDKDISSLSGFGINAELGIRFDFYQHLFLQLGLDGGILNQNKMKTSKSMNKYVKQTTLFLSPSIHIGFSVFGNSKNNCLTCPDW